LKGKRQDKMQIAILEGILEGLETSFGVICFGKTLKFGEMRFS
jgi:hypothetical protein